MASIKNIFKNRNAYDQSNPNFDLPELPSLYTKYYIDTWHVSPFYGKVDTLGIPVIPNSTFLRYCTYGSDKVSFLALQPVMDFFLPLREQYEQYYQAGAINKNGKYFKKELLPTRAYLNSDTDYFTKISGLYRNFVDYLLQNNKFNSIKNYDDFLNEFVDYIKFEELYFTRAGFVESYDFSLLSTGLAIEIYSEDTSNDNERQGFFDDINSDAFLELCIRNNMKIDREIPWRLFLDIRSITSKEGQLAFTSTIEGESIIKQYIPEFDKDIQLFFDIFYNRVVPYDDDSYAYFEEFVTLIQSFYTSFLSSFPTYKTYSISNCGKANVQIIARDLLNENTIVYDAAKYVNLYLQFRNIELGKIVDKEILEQQTLIANQIFKAENITKSYKQSTISAIKHYTNNTGTLAYRSPSLFELDEKPKTV